VKLKIITGLISQQTFHRCRITLDCIHPQQLQTNQKIHVHRYTIVTPYTDIFSYQYYKHLAPKMVRSKRNGMPVIEYDQGKIKTKIV